MSIPMLHAQRSLLSCLKIRLHAAQVASGTLSSSSLDRYTCIALAGVAAEYVNFGQAEGGLNDVQQLDGLLRALQVGLSLST